MKYLRPHGHGHKYQRAIPAHLQPLLGKKIRTVYYDASVSRADAQRRALVQWATDSAEFERLSKLTADDVEEIVALGGFDGVVAEADRTAQELAELQALAAKTLAAPDDLPGLAGYKDTIARLKRLDVVPQHFAKPYADGIARLAGQVRRAKGTGDNLTPLLDHWEKEAAPRDPRARERHQKGLDRFIAAMGNLRPSEVTQATAVDFRDWLADPVNDFGPGAQQKALEQMRAIFSASVKSGRLRFNPFTGINPRKQPGRKLVDLKRGKSFNSEEVRAILDNLPSLAEPAGTKARQTAIVWAVRLAVWQGARINEICGLRKEDVRTEDGIVVLDINDEHRRIKNAASIRTIPLHPTCADFEKFADTAKGPWVFEALNEYKEGQRAGWIIRRFGPYLDSIGITRPRVTLHSLRHTWVDAARNAGVPEDVRRAIAGHEGEAGAHGGYGRGFKPKRMLEELVKVDPTKA